MRIGILVKDSGELIFTIGIGILDKDWYFEMGVVFLIWILSD